ncbi:MAG TPA: glycosyltransferase [Armatimonadota bacterium]|nr:glycosyltransferase [Armatimonadota bacterium]
MQLLLHVASFVSIMLIWFFALYQVSITIGGLILYLRSRRERRELFDERTALPPVTILVPAHNEEKVIERTICCLLALRYPQDRLHILVIDDASTDATPAILDRLAAAEPRVRVLHRTRAEGGGRGKAAALNAAMRRVETEFVAVFDADNRPEPDAVAYLVAHMLREPGLGAAVGRFRTGNKHANLLTRVINIEGLFFQGTVQSGRWAFLRVAALTGTNYVIRRSALDAVGGWDEEALTEDTELSVRLYQHGYHIAFVRYSITWEQEPETPAVWIKQRTRWARGNNYAIVKLLRGFKASPYKGLLCEALFTLFVPYIFMIAVLGSQVVAILSLSGLHLTGLLAVVSNYWWLVLALYLCEVTLVLAYDRETSLGNTLLAALMYFSYCHAWLIAVLRSLWLDVIVREQRTWYKTVRFDTDIIPRCGTPAVTSLPELPLDEDSLPALPPETPLPPARLDQQTPTVTARYFRR